MARISLKNTVSMPTMLSWPSQNMHLCRPLLLPSRSVLMTVYQIRRTRQGAQGDVRRWRCLTECRQGRSSKLIGFKSCERYSRLLPQQYVLPPGSVVYTGCVGDDDLAEQLKIANKREGLHQVYQVKKGEKTGACAVVITGHYR